MKVTEIGRDRKERNKKHIDTAKKNRQKNRKQSDSQNSKCMASESRR
jgi:hypothetical protein